MFLSPAIKKHSPTFVAWLMFCVAMIICLYGMYVLGFFLVGRGIESVVRFGPSALILEVGMGIAALMSAFSYIYWLLSHVVSDFFTSTLSRVDAVYVAVGTFTTTGTGNIYPMARGAKLLVATQALLDVAVVAVILAIIVTRGIAEYKRYSEAGISVRLGPS